VNIIFPDDEAADAGMARLYQLLDRMKKSGYLDDYVLGSDGVITKLSPKGAGAVSFIKETALKLGHLTALEIYTLWQMMTSAHDTTFDFQFVCARQIIDRMERAGLVARERKNDEGGRVRFSFIDNDAVLAIREFDKAIGRLTRRDVFLVWVWCCQHS